MKAMMLFNLTKSATEHLFPESVAKQQGDIIQQRRGENIVLYERDSEQKDTVDFVFHLHAIKVKKIYCIVAIEKETRWVHMIHHVKKGDVREFTRRFHERLVNGIVNMIMHAKPNSIALLDMTVDNYAAANQEMLFVYKSNNSCNSHISHIAWVYRRVIDEHGFPGNEIDAIYFDIEQNDYLKKTNQSKDYFSPSEAMLKKFLRLYTSMTEIEIQLAVKSNRKAWISAAATNEGNMH